MRKYIKEINLKTYVCFSLIQIFIKSSFGELISSILYVNKVDIPEMNVTIFMI